MPLAPGTRLGPYEVHGALGAGGMGEVYRATDTTLKRQVALKILPATLASDPDRLARFQREAEVLAAVNHPNIAAIHGVEESGDVRALVLELVEGPTLAEKIAGGSIPLDEALPIARQIAEALEAAHEQGIVHRDLKPANIKVRDNGTVKVLDFGLAKLTQAPAGGAASVSQAPTITTPAMTQMGMLLGTAAYMSPEQAKGREADRRSDIWAFGAVLYEMLTGTRAFPGEDLSETLAAVIKSEPAWAALPPPVPTAVRRLLRRCLAKDRARRLSDIADARLEIDEALSESLETGFAAPQARPSRLPLAWTALAAGAMAAAATWFGMTGGPAVAVNEMRVDIATTPATRYLASFAISPDGRQIVYAADADGTSRLWLRPLETGSARVLPGTGNGQLPFWSPDSRSIAFFADGQLKRLDLDTGSLRELAATNIPAPGSWNRDDVILFATRIGEPIHRVSAGGGPPAPVTRLAEGQGLHSAPHFLPDGRHFLYHSQAPSNHEGRGVWVAALDGSGATRLVDTESQAIFSAGHLLYHLQGTLVAHPFDPERRVLTGTAEPVAEQVAFGARASAFSASPAGVIAYRRGMALRENRRLAWVGRDGTELETVVGTDLASSPALSRDGRRVAVASQVELGNVEVSLLDTRRGGRIRLTFNPGVDAFPVWEPAGNAVAFQSYKGGNGDLYWKATTSAGPEELLVSTPEPKHPTDWSPDGRVLMYRSLSSTSGYDLWTVSLDVGHKTAPLVKTAANERDGQFSPDGKWLAYESDETGRYEIYLQSFPTGPKIPVSVGGGAQPRWNPEGTELFYIASDDALMAVPIRFEREPVLGTAKRLFTTQVGGGVIENVARQQYAVSPDGQRFLMNILAPSENRAPITLILNWKLAR